MPIYEYVCQDCEKVFETIRPMSQSDAPIPCALCGGTAHQAQDLGLLCRERRQGRFRHVRAILRFVRRRELLPLRTLIYKHKGTKDTM